MDSLSKARPGGASSLANVMGTAPVVASPLAPVLPATVTHLTWPPSLPDSKCAPVEALGALTGRLQAARRRGVLDTETLNLLAPHEPDSKHRISCGPPASIEWDGVPSNALIRSMVKSGCAQWQAHEHDRLARTVVHYLCDDRFGKSESLKYVDPKCGTRFARRFVEATVSDALRGRDSLPWGEEAPDFRKVLELRPRDLDTSGGTGDTDMTFERRLALSVDELVKFLVAYPGQFKNLPALLLSAAEVLAPCAPKRGGQSDTISELAGVVTVCGRVMAFASPRCAPEEVVRMAISVIAPFVGRVVWTLTPLPGVTSPPAEHLPESVRAVSTKRLINLVRLSAGLGAEMFLGLAPGRDRNDSCTLLASMQLACFVSRVAVDIATTSWFRAEPSLSPERAHLRADAVAGTVTNRLLKLGKLPRDEWRELLAWLDKELQVLLPSVRFGGSPPKERRIRIAAYRDMFCRVGGVLIRNHSPLDQVEERWQDVARALRPSLAFAPSPCSVDSKLMRPARAVRLAYLSLAAVQRAMGAPAGLDAMTVFGVATGMLEDPQLHRSCARIHAAFPKDTLTDRHVLDFLAIELLTKSRIKDSHDFPVNGDHKGRMSVEDDRIRSQAHDQMENGADLMQLLLHLDRHAGRAHHPGVLVATLANVSLDAAAALDGRQVDVQRRQRVGGVSIAPALEAVFNAVCQVKGGTDVSVTAGSGSDDQHIKPLMPTEAAMRVLGRGLRGRTLLDEIEGDQLGMALACCTLGIFGAVRVATGVAPLAAHVQLSAIGLANALVSEAFPGQWEMLREVLTGVVDVVVFGKDVDSKHRGKTETVAALVRRAARESTCPESEREAFVASVCRLQAPEVQTSRSPPRPRSHSG